MGFCQGGFGAVTPAVSVRPQPFTVKQLMNAAMIAAIFGDGDAVVVRCASKTLLCF